MGDLEKVMDSIDDLSGALKKIERYNYLFYLTGRMIISVLSFMVILFFAYFILLEHDFQEINPYLGTVKLSGYGIGGYYLDVSGIMMIIGAVAVYIVTVLLNRRALRKREWKAVPFDRSKGRDEIVGAITGIDWEKTRKELKRAKFSFIIYNLSIIGIYSFLLFFILLFLFVFSSVLILFLIHFTASIATNFPLIYSILLAISVLLSLLILRKTLKASLHELGGLDVILDQLRWFLDEFEKSGLQT